LAGSEDFATGEIRLKRLRWLCRRGMRELEILLEGFLLRENATLLEGGWSEFEALLACEDDRLWDWFQGRLDDEAEPFKPLIHAICR
jgi:antitoxin CptB